MPKGNMMYEYSSHASRLNWDLLLNGGYNKHIPPASNRSLAAVPVAHDSTDTQAARPTTMRSLGSMAGTDVKLQLRFYKIESVDTSTGHMHFKVWLRQKWRDDRLAWDPKAYGNVTHTYFLAVGHNKPEETEIWVPDLTIYNLGGAGLNDQLEGELAHVSYTGDVFWSRPGTIDVLCRFSGLVAFPFDELQCTFEIGGWSLDETHQGLSFFADEVGGPFELSWHASAATALTNKSGVEVTIGTSYNEYDIKGISASLVRFQYASSIHPFTVARYTVVTTRARSYYWLLVVVPCLLLTVFSFSVFWLSPNVGERLGYGITLILATEVFKLVVGDVVPVCGELLWVDLFTNMCSLFCFISLFESCVVLAVSGRSDEGPAHNAALKVLDYDALSELIETPGAWMHSQGDPTLSAAAVALVECKQAALRQAADRTRTSPALPPSRPPSLPSSPPPSPPRHAGPAASASQSRPARVGRVALRRAPPPPPAPPPARDTRPQGVPEDVFTRTSDLDALRCVETSSCTSSPGVNGAGYNSDTIVGEELNSPDSGAHARSRRKRRSVPNQPTRGGAVPIAQPHSHVAGEATTEFDEASADDTTRDDEQARLALTRAFATPLICRLQARFRGRRMRHAHAAAVRAWEVGEMHETRRLLAFEATFFELDRDGLGHLTVDEYRTWLSYAAPGAPIAARVAALRTAADCETISSRVHRVNFVRACAELLRDTPDEVVDAATRAFAAAVDARQACSARQWSKAARRIDDHAKLIIPASFAFMFTFLSGANFEDPYADFSLRLPAPQFEGIYKNFSLELENAVMMVGLPLAVAVLYFLRRLFARGMHAHEVRKRLAQVQTASERMRRLEEPPSALSSDLTGAKHAAQLPKLDTDTAKHHLATCQTRHDPGAGLGRARASPKPVAVGP